MPLAQPRTRASACQNLLGHQVVLSPIGRGPSEVRDSGVSQVPGLTFESGYPPGARKQAQIHPAGNRVLSTAHVEFADAAVTTERPNRESPTVVEGRQR